MYHRQDDGKYKEGIQTAFGQLLKVYCLVSHYEITTKNETDYLCATHLRLVQKVFSKFMSVTDAETIYLEYLRP